MRGVRAKGIERFAASLSVRNFRLFALGQVVSVAGTWMMVVAQDWLVLELSGGSAGALGVVTALQFGPLLLTPYGGRLADLHDKRTLLTGANLASGVLAGLLSLLVFTGAVGLWHIHVFAVCLGVVNAVEIPTRMSFVGELVGDELLPNASALSAAYFNVARVAGPALAGPLISGFGVGPVMALNAVSYLATTAGLRMIDPRALHRPNGRKARGRVADGIRYIAARGDLALPMALVAVVGLFGMNFQLVLPLMAKNVLHADAASFGLITASFAMGALLAALATTTRRARPSQATVTGAALAFGALEIATAVASSWAAVVLLAFTGFASMYFAQAANHRIQLGCDPRLRGRVLSLYTLVLQGSTPLGALMIGALSERFGVRAGLCFGGLASLAAGVGALAAGRLRRSRPPHHISPNLHRITHRVTPDHWRRQKHATGEARCSCHRSH